MRVGALSLPRRTHTRTEPTQPGGVSVPAAITIAGVGLRGVGHLTPEAEDAIREARVVFVSAYNTGLADHVRALAPRAEVHDAEQGEYRVGMYRPEMYRRMASRVLDRAREAPGVLMLAPGSAVVVDLVTQLVLEGARDSGLDVRVLPGVSSIESVLAEMRYDASAGVQVVLAQRLVLERARLDPSRAAIVLQPAYYDTLYFAGAPLPRAGRFDALRAQLAETWSPEAAMALVITPTGLEPADASVLWFRLGDLSRLERAITPAHTLFVPPERAAPRDEEMLARLRSWDSLRSQLEHDARGALAQHRRGAALDVPGDLAAESDRLAARWRAR